MIQITKIKFADETTIVYEEYDEVTSSNKSVTLTSKEPPLQKFKDSVAGLIEYVAIYCRLDWEYWENGKITGITFKYNDEGDVGIVVTAQHQFDLPCVINTPYINPAVIIDNGSLMRLVEEIQKYAAAFVAGDRAVKQLSLLEVK